LSKPVLTKAKTQSGIIYVNKVEKKRKNKFICIVRQKNNLIEQAKLALNIPLDNKIILCLDGGGMRGILSIQLLKALEKIAGAPAHSWVDMVAGTSTGAIISALIATGHTANKIEEIYDNLVFKVFQPRLLGHRFINPPRFSKKPFRDLAKGLFSNLSIADACCLHRTDLLITAKDMAAGEETYFTGFCMADGNVHGTYAPVLLRAAVEASMSAPTYFNPLERFVDGGTTTYNNPSSAAIIEALNYSRNPDYTYGKITVISLGTGISPQFIPPGKAGNPHGPDLFFWLNWLMTEIGHDASDMQTDLLRSPRFRDLLDYRRFQISLDTTAIRQLPDIALEEPINGAHTLHGLNDRVLSDIDMADTGKYALIKCIGIQMAAFVESENKFGADLVLGHKKNRDLLVTARGDVASILSQMRDAGWLDAQSVD
jgi:hypothetical protein